MRVSVTTATARASPAGSRVCFTRARYERSPGLGVTRRCTYQVESSALAGWHEGVIWPACRRAQRRRQPVWYRPEGLARGLVLVCAPAGSARLSCWPAGPGAAGGWWPGCRWTLPTTIRRGFGATRLSLRGQPDAAGFLARELGDT